MPETIERHDKPSYLKGPRLKLKYLYGGEVLYQPGESLKPRTLTDFEFVYVISGRASYYAEQQIHEAKPGSLILGKAGSRERYVWDPEHPTRHAFFHFSIDELPRDWPNYEQWPTLQEEHSPVLSALFKHILQRIYLHPDWPTAPPGTRDCLLVETLIDLFLESGSIKETSFERDRPEPVRRALKWIRQQIDENPRKAFSLRDIAHAAGCSEKHLCRVFRQSIGHAPAHAGRMMRLQLALALIANSSLSIKEIAQNCGFESPFYFSRCFRKTFKKSPSEVRSGLSRGIPPPRGPLPVDLTPRVHW